jgi:hypothetical protein
MFDLIPSLLALSSISHDIAIHYILGLIQGQLISIWTSLVIIANALQDTLTQDFVYFLWSNRTFLL